MAKAKKTAPESFITIRSTPTKKTIAPIEDQVKDLIKEEAPEVIPPEVKKT